MGDNRGAESPPACNPANPGSKGRRWGFGAGFRGALGLGAFFVFSPSVCGGHSTKNGVLLALSRGIRDQERKERVSSFFFR
jgi:hypothetical protein